MAKIFYDHLVLREEVTAEIDAHNLPPEERDELVHLVDEILHHTTLNVILNHLPKEHHRDFMVRFHAAPHDPELLLFLQRQTTVDIESEIHHHAVKVKQDIINDIRKSHTRHHS